MKSYIRWSLISALLLWIAWPPIPYTGIILLIAFVPLLLGIENIIHSDGRHKGRKVFWTSFLAITIWNTASIYWVYNAMNAFLPGFASLLISFIPYTLGPLLLSTAFWLYYWIRKKTSSSFGLLALPGLWILAEYLHQTWDLSFPWMTLGNGLADLHPLVQWYEYTGVYGGSVWIWAVNILVFVSVMHYQKMQSLSKPWVNHLSLAALLIIPMCVSLFTYFNFQERINPSEVVVVQPNIDPYHKFGRITPEEQLNRLLTLSSQVAAPNTEFFIWPETAISSYNGIDEDTFREYPAYQVIQDFLNDYRNGNILTGIESYRLYPTPLTATARPFGSHYIDHFNSSVLIDKSSKVQYYHKSKLVPGAEKMPFGETLDFLKPLFAHFGGSTGGYGSQDEPSVLYAESGIGAAPVICYESIWGNYVNRYVQQGAQFIAIVTNDGWWGNTSGKDQHLLYAKLRAIENRRWVARSANTGISAFINQRGDIVQKTDWWTEDALSQEINLNEDMTLYTQKGDWIVYLTSIVSIACLILSRTRLYNRSKK